MSVPEISKEMRDRIALVKNQRARRLLELIVEHGEVTTEKLEDEFDYKHPPRAKGDARDLGFPIVSKTVKSKDGTRNISAYSFDPSGTFIDGRSGRKPVTKAFRDQLLILAAGRCAICGGSFPDRALQVDHRIPFVIGGEAERATLADFQMLCGSCNRSKSWTCEHECPNWSRRDATVCATCIWASPEAYRHIATMARRQVTITWDDERIASFEALQRAADQAGLSAAEYLRQLVDES